MNNPFAFAIIVHPAPVNGVKSKKRGKWLSSGGLSSNRIYAECFSLEGTAKAVATATAFENPGWTFTVRKFDKG
jgi:hypothetical protein